MRKTLCDGVAFIWLHGSNSIDSQFHMVPMELYVWPKILCTFDAWDCWKPENCITSHHNNRMWIRKNFFQFLATTFHSSRHTTESIHHRLHGCVAMFQSSRNRWNGGLWCGGFLWRFWFCVWIWFQFYADLHQLSKAHSQAVSLMKQSQMDPLLRNNVKQILEATRPLSFC